MDLLQILQALTLSYIVAGLFVTSLLFFLFFVDNHPNGEGCRELIDKWVFVRGKLWTYGLMLPFAFIASAAIWPYFLIPPKGR